MKLPQSSKKGPIKIIPKANLIDKSQVDDQPGSASIMKFKVKRGVSSSTIQKILASPGVQDNNTSKSGLVNMGKMEGQKPKLIESGSRAFESKGSKVKINLKPPSARRTVLNSADVQAESKGSSEKKKQVKEDN